MLEKIKNQQHLLLWSIIIVLSVILCFVTSFILGSKKVFNTKITHSPKQLNTGVSRINPQEVWVHDFTARAEITQKRLEAMEQTLEQLLKLNTKKEELFSGSMPPVASLKNDLTNIYNTTKSDNISDLPLPPNEAAMSGFAVIPTSFRSKELTKISLPRGTNIKPLKTTDNTIPAGAFAEAILLGGVDASTSIQASSDPRPILLRLTDPGTLPRRFKSDLEGCHVLAASYGDLSSERVFMRLEKLGCVERKTGEVIEIGIQGYVAGEDGRAGVRGAVVDRAGESMRNAMVGGFFSSIGKFLGQAKTPITFSPTTGLAQNNALDTNEIFRQSAANGMGGALDKYADFYIKRAEQMQPVIQVAAGRLVDLVFTQGLDFADSRARQTLSKTNDQKRYQQVQNIVDNKGVDEFIKK